MMTERELETLYTEYMGKVLGYIRSRVSEPRTAEDLCQDVFEKTVRYRDRYDPDKASPGTWLYTITKNTVLNYLTRKRPAEEMQEELTEETVSELTDGSLPEDSLITAETLGELAEALEELPEGLCDIIVLRYYDDIPLNVIATRLGISYGAVKLRHQKALKILRDRISG